MSDESEHAIEQTELAAWDMAKALSDEDVAHVNVFMSRVMSNLNGEKNVEIARLRAALEMIARKKKLDAVAAASMRAIAISALSSRKDI